MVHTERPTATRLVVSIVAMVLVMGGWFALVNTGQAHAASQSGKSDCYVSAGAAKSGVVECLGNPPVGRVEGEIYKCAGAGVIAFVFGLPVAPAEAAALAAAGSIAGCGWGDLF